jgi:hypothetical protein
MKQESHNFDKKQKILISLIHNNDDERLSIIRPQIENLISQLNKKSNVVFLEMSEQPVFSSINLFTAILRDIMFWRLDRDWKRYREIRNNIFLYDLFLLIFKIIKKYIFQIYSYKKIIKTSSIEIFVTDKHIRSFLGAFEDKYDYLLIFEDDAIFKDNSVNRLLDLFEDLEDQNKPLYIDLAGGFSFAELRVDRLNLLEDSGFIHFSKPVTNTACCYLINRKQIEIFNLYIMKNPVLRYLSIDCLMNRLFILQYESTKRGEGGVTFCYHSIPSIFGHGSMIGKFKSWAR